MSRGLGKTQKKILLLLSGGLALGLSGSPTRYFKIIKLIGREWKEIERQSLKRAIKNLYTSKLIGEKQNKDGTITMFLTGEGKRRALTYDLEKMEIKKPKQWDKKWRVVLFDIPDNRKKSRETLRFHLKNLGFYKFQESVFVHPYNCKDEIDYLIEFYDLRRFVRFIIADSIDNEIHLKTHFRLL
ncbi:MAG: CRISPR-associated endonuclease Cas2 [Candidatus Tagabacteria bacterium CG_4_10_14_0_2_um_filter_40_13]|uniref:CRISPR-associated endonuclease Cas2 n=1 Tax=Candidatus Tagabacteria bacterium CG03_land_8_20_14_0_80_41_22 TaxID=1975020 RepID=A0A2M7B9P1_9BACT|nr:MAG: CRISPR-associated endonuclease Cas2 [Candidatus Tagabacteria bacterium CG11_big_fil_rev_8_21_14_0_20_41_11]PIU99769.1 MAG: CRISPR-associated endonuclease Cas2 [Candidatus Tagabacteria bacterium CG03_land_8_20_14_0_80_41_22]PIZ56283.1 MAG: CRISPR-associated endonuclease Cas2 [Candidatus Tagabacteria bacterium CG_4_10_14_0_2_um_filter_40_13]